MEQQEYVLNIARGRELLGGDCLLDFIFGRPQNLAMVAIVTMKGERQECRCILTKR